MILQSPVPTISRIFHAIGCPKIITDPWKRFDCQEYMSQVQCPKLIIYGTRDQYYTSTQLKVYIMDLHFK